MDIFYRRPKYFKDFHCIGGECPESCCDKWEVLWEKNELDNLNRASSSDELKSVIEKSFDKTEREGTFKVILCEDKRCPFHNHETDLCDIQKQLGERYLGSVCRLYPREYYKRGGTVICSCYT